MLFGALIAVYLVPGQHMLPMLQTVTK